MLRLEVHSQPGAASVLVLGDLQHPGGRRHAFLRVRVEQEDEVRVLLQLPALAQVVLGRRLLAFDGRGNLAQADHGDPQLLRHPVQAHADVCHDVPALPARRVDQLHVVDEDHVKAPLDRLGADPFQGLVVPQDPQVDLIGPHSGLSGGAEILVGELLALGARQWNAGHLILCQQSVFKVFLRGLQAEESHPVSVRRHVIGELQREGRLADGAVRCDHSELSAADVQVAVQRFDAPVQVSHRALVLHPVAVVADQLAEAQILALISVLQHGAHALPGCCCVVRPIRVYDGQGLGLHGCEPCRVLADLQPRREVSRGRGVDHTVPQQLLVLAAGSVQDGDGVQLSVLVPELPGRLEDVPQLRLAEVRGLRALEDQAGAVVRVDQQGADHRLLRSFPGGQIHGRSSRCGSGSSGSAISSSQRRCRR